MIAKSVLLLGLGIAIPFVFASWDDIDIAKAHGNVTFLNVGQLLTEAVNEDFVIDLKIGPIIDEVRYLERAINRFLKDGN